VNQLKKQNPFAVIVDSGDLFFEKESIPDNLRQSATLKGQFIIDAYNRIGCDALNVGERDLALGAEFLKVLERKANFPFISANLTDRQNNPLFKPYIIKKIGGRNVGIFGILGDTGQIASRVKQITQGTVILQDVVKSAELMVKELRGQVDLVIALTHQNVGRDWVIARRVQGIDIIIGGHDKQKVTDPYVADKTRIVQSGEKGQYLGQLEVTIQPDGSKSYNNRLIPLGKAVPDDPSVKSMVKEYYRQVAELHRLAGQSVSQASAKADACEACHSFQYGQWKASRHAAAYASLVKRGRQFDPECLECHTTRFEEPDGFTMKSQQAEFVSVQCDSCHGSSVEHIKACKPMEKRKTGQEGCVRCHTADRSPAFSKEYLRFLQKTKH
jgi:2',3'-cyclic-nucleotide 2'-phosphodiesterase (5'-nucleotidase family)